MNIKKFAEKIFFTCFNQSKQYKLPVNWIIDAE